ncbi:CDP-diacylglycerol--serine O-phosphatidyltransferase [bacterium]|nr:CDP-diacylglycerol--serine O-phosphatidyltransferase [bacterium]NIN91676.1 CDP-diacylglycerol--serine O-phosphatidyltransferase [bacterium]NIO18028.1 CDP-diacylglycerol--serine O-phosphatidyltransferase [bacterium]NIO72991.1 CDP-diacylglycerol--serine O-phosphatidyltransferase [bacterium]
MKKGIYFVPGLFTLGNAGLGFYSIISSIERNFTSSAWAILLAVILDVFDGRIARLTRSTSRFGLEFDSLADLISFGLAPSILMYQVVLKNIGWGVLVAFLFAIAGVLRLARFNVRVMEKDIAYFDGLCIPVAGGMLASFYVLPFWAKETHLFFSAIPLIMIFLSLLMVSKIKYINLKKVRLTKRQPFKILIIMVVALVIWFFSTELISIIFLAYFLGYTLSGILNALWRFYRLRLEWVKQR